MTTFPLFDVPSVHPGSSVGTSEFADGNKLAQLKLSLGPCSSCFQRFHRLKVSLSRLHIGHTRLTNGEVMAREAPAVCGRCQVHLSVFHVLVECPA